MGERVSPGVDSQIIGQFAVMVEGKAAFWVNFD